MLRTTFQQQYISIFCSDKDSKPLQLWRVVSDNEAAAVQFVMDPEVSTQVLQLKADNIANTHIECPAEAELELGVKLPNLVLQLKPLDRKAHFSVEVSLADDTGATRNLRASNYVSDTRITPQMCHMPLLLEHGRWNSVVLDLPKLCKAAFGTQYRECHAVVVHPNCKLRRIYFAELVAGGGELPHEFVLRKVKQ